MKKAIIFPVILFSILLASCRPGPTDKRAELEEYRRLVREYTEKIRVLESEMDSIPGENKEIRATSVEVKMMKAEPFSSFFEAKGSVEAVMDAFISPETSGQIKSINVNRGERVKKGQLLMELNTDVTANSISEVKTSLELASKLFEKQEQLWEKEIGSEIQYLEAKNAKESLEARLATLKSQLEMAYIRAPFSGIVDDIMVKTGELASPGMRLLRLVNLEEMRISAEVSEAFLANVSLGDKVSISFSSLPELSLEAPVSRVGTVIDPITRTFPVEVLLSNKKEEIKPNMLASVMIQDYDDPDALIVPSIILKDDFNGTFLFKAVQEGNKNIARKVYVKTGKTVQDQTKIIRGIKENDLVVITGYNLISDGESLKIMN
jgi:RND family efflux transporter MFP subunit